MAHDKLFGDRNRCHILFSNVLIKRWYFFFRVHDTVSQDLGNTLVQWYFPSENLDIIIAIIDRKTLFLRTWDSFIVIPSFHYVVIISRYYWEFSGRSYSAQKWSFPLKFSLENMSNHGGITINHITETFFTFLSEIFQRKTSFLYELTLSAVSLNKWCHKRISE